MPEQGFKTCAARLLAIGLLCTVLIAIGPRAHAADVSAIVSAAFQVHSWLTKQFRSDFDPTHSAVLRNQELLKDLELRFTEFENAIDDAINKLDRIPVQYREILTTMLDDMQGNRVLALVDEIVHDQVIIDQGKVPTIDPRVRLHDLQVETGALTRRGDLNAPTLIVAYGYELALMASLGAHVEEIKQRRTRSHERLLRVLDGNISNSLAHAYSVGMREIRSEFAEMNWGVGRTHYSDGMKHFASLCVAQKCSEPYVDMLNICERVHGTRLTDVGKTVDKSVTGLFQSLKEDDSKLLDLQQRVSILWSWEAILRSVAEAVPQELQEEQHRRALRDHAKPETLNHEVRTARADVAEMHKHLESLRSTYLREEHQFVSSPPAGRPCP